MLSLSLPRLASFTPTSTFASHRRHFLRRKPHSVSISSSISPASSLPIASFRPSPFSRRFRLAARADSELVFEDDDEEEEEEEEGEEEVEDEPIEVGEEEGEGDDIYIEGEEEEEYDEEGQEEYDEEEEEEYDDEDDGFVRAHIVLKFIWMEKNIGVALEKLVPGTKGSVPLTPYYFWPRKDAWEELKAVLEERGWVSQKRMIIMLNQATDIINLWQQSGNPTPTA